METVHTGLERLMAGVEDYDRALEKWGRQKE